jgi:hypothetical protein
MRRPHQRRRIMVQMVMTAVGVRSTSNAVSVAQQVRVPMFFQKLAGLAILGSGYVVIVASLAHAISG